MRRLVALAVVTAWLTSLAPISAQAAPAPLRAAAVSTPAPSITVPTGSRPTKQVHRTAPASPQPQPAAGVQARALAQTPAPHLTTTGGAWSEIGPSPISNGYTGRVLALAKSGGTTGPDAAHPLFLGSAGGGVWKTTNGFDWVVAGNYDALENLSVDAVAVDPHTFGTAATLLVLAGSGEVASAQDAQAGTGIYRSADGGATWTRTGAALFGTGNYAISSIVFDPASASEYAFAGVTGKAASANTGVAVSTDHGATWTVPANTLKGHDVTDLAIDNAGNLYAAVGDGSAADGAYYSTDHGQTFALLKNDGDGTQLWWKLALAPSTAGNPRATQVVYAAEGSTYPSSGGSGAVIHIFRSGNGGVSWLDITNSVAAADQSSGAQQAWYDFWVAVDPTDPNNVYFATTDIFNAPIATTWSDVTKVYGGPCQCDFTGPGNVHPDQHAIAFYDHTHIYLGNDGGVQRTANAMVSFATASNGLGTTQFYGGSVSPDQNSIIGGLQDNGNVVSENAGGFFDDQTGGDGFFTAIDPTNTNNRYAEYANGLIHIATDSTAGVLPSTTVDPSSGTDPNVAFAAPMALDSLPATPVFYAGRRSLWTTSNQGGTWTRHYVSSNGTAGGDLLAGVDSTDFISWIAPANTTTYVLDYFGNTFVTTNGTNWFMRNDGTTACGGPYFCRTFPNLANSITVDTTAPATAYETVAGAGTGQHIYKTINSGATWTDVSLTLPNYNFFTVAIDPAAHNTIYAGSDQGVFVSANAGATWSNMGTGLPHARVSGLVVRTGELYAFTHGRGAWKVALTAGVNHLVVTSGTATSGTPATVTVQALDGANLPVAAYVGKVTLAFSDGLMPQTSYTFQVTDTNATHAIPATFRVAGTTTVTATDNLGTTAGMNTFTVNPGVATQFLVKGTGPVTSGASFNVQVIAQDAVGNTATAYTQRVHWTSTDAGATLPGDYTFTGGDAGVHVFPVTPHTAGTRNYVATDNSVATATTGITGTLSAIQVVPGPVASLAATGAGTAVAGVPYSLTVTAYDAALNIATGYRGTVTFTAFDGGTVKPADYTFVSGDGGTRVFSFTIIDDGPQSLTVTDTGTPSLTSTRSGIMVSPAGIDHFDVWTNASTIAGDPLSVTVVARDVFANGVPTYAGTLHFTVLQADGSSTLPLDYTMTVGGGMDNGSHTFTNPVLTRVVANQRIVVTDAATPSLTGSSVVIAVSPAAANKVVFTGAGPTSTVAGVSLTGIEATIEDSYGNVRTDSTAMVTLTAFTGSDTLHGTTSVSAVAGVATFSATNLQKVGNYTIRASSAGLNPSTPSASFPITPAAAATTLFNTQPSSRTTDSAFGGLQVYFLDQFGNLCTSDSTSVGQMSLNGGVLGLWGTTRATALSGVAAFSGFGVKDVGSNFTLIFTPASTSVAGATSSTFNITVGAEAKLLFGSVANPPAAGAPIPDFTVMVNDQWGNLTASTAPITVATQDGSPLLSGGGGVPAINGTATFTGLINNVAGPHILLATGSSLGSAMSAQFTVPPAGGASFTAVPTTSTGRIDLSVTVRDQFGNLATTFTDPVQVSTPSDGALNHALVTETYTYSPADLGVHVFTFHFTSSGSKTFTVSDTAGGSPIAAVPATASVNVNATFYFAEGTTVGGFQEYLYLLSPTATGTAVVTYYKTDATSKTVNIALTAGSVRTVNVNDPTEGIGPNNDVSIKVVMPAEGIAERVLHFNTGRWHGSTDQVGTAAPNIEWDFAEGSTQAIFDEYLTLQNPSDQPAATTLKYLTPGGAITKTITLAPFSRTTIAVFGGDGSSGPCNPGNCGAGRGLDLGVQVRASVPIIAERPMYVNGATLGLGGPINDGHDVFGANNAAPLWNFAEGTTQGGFAEYLTIGNANNSPSSIQITYLYAGGAAPVVRFWNVPANGRQTVFVNSDAGAGNDVSVKIDVLNGVNVFAERPMYMYKNFGGGIVAGAHDVVGSTSAGQQIVGFAAASTGGGNNDYLTVENPTGTDATLTVTYFPGGVRGGISVRAHSRATVDMSGGQGPGGGLDPVGIQVTSNVPVIIEKPTYSVVDSTYGATDTSGYTPPGGSF